jgi:AcrR family transcriptional regulator
MRPGRRKEVVEVTDAATPGGDDHRPQRLPAARRRRQLLVAAIELFGTQGYHDTSMDDIAEEAGVTKPVLYQHFPSKRDLSLELLERVGNDLTAAVAATAGSEVLPNRRVLAGFLAYFRFVSEQTAAFQLLFGTGARGTDEFADVIRRMEDGMAEVISGLIEAGTDPEHRRMLAYAIVGVAEVTARHWVLTDSDATRPTGQRLPQLDPAAGDLLAGRLADLMWAGLRGLPAGDPTAAPASPAGSTGRSAETACPGGAPLP